MTDKDIRWIQRFNNFDKALKQLGNAVEIARARELSKLEEQGLIQAFEFTHELAWNTLKDFLEERGVSKIYGSKDATREAFKAGLIENSETWIEMIANRNLSTHTYDEFTAAKIVSAVLYSYFPEFEELHVKMRNLKEEFS
jgi:nucleotidyltransferase substrate binding protein (TIGR01987 family)